MHRPVSPFNNTHTGSAVVAMLDVVAMGGSRILSSAVGEVLVSLDSDLDPDPGPDPDPDPVPDPVGAIFVGPQPNIGSNIVSQAQAASVAHTHEWAGRGP